MEDKPVLLTADGLLTIERELQELIGARRVEVADRIRQARDFGDITENSEYTEAKNEQSLLEGRILTLEAMVRNAVVIESEAREKGVVAIGATVSVASEEGPETYEIVGAAEADPLHGRISNESPLGKALIGHRAGDEVDWSGPIGTSRVKVISVD
ncbi:MAG: transcription elongation factor GreA [Candidatus Dormibacteraceae bacterium]|nr:transcription elongation factor GreA [Candidatus Acidoferrales bacterium]